MLNYTKIFFLINYEVRLVEIMGSRFAYPNCSDQPNQVKWSNSFLNFILLSTENTHFQLDNFGRKRPGEKIYLPKTKEDDPFDAQELGKGFVRFQLFSKHMVEEHKGVQCK